MNRIPFLLFVEWSVGSSNQKLQLNTFMNSRIGRLDLNVTKKKNWLKAILIWPLALEHVIFFRCFAQCASDAMVRCLLFAWPTARYWPSSYELLVGNFTQQEPGCSSQQIILRITMWMVQWTMYKWVWCNVHHHHRHLECQTFIQSFHQIIESIHTSSIIFRWENHTHTAKSIIQILFTCTAWYHVIFICLQY